MPRPTGSGVGLVRPGDGPRVRAVVRLLVHRLPGRAAGDGGRLDGRGPAHAADRGRPEDALPVPGHPAGPDRHGADRGLVKPTELAASAAIHGPQSGPLAPWPRRRRAAEPAIIPIKIDPATGKPMLDAATGGRCSTTTWPRPTCCCAYFPTGMLGLGLTALLASFMSGMAGNVTAFNTVWTYDIYQAYIRRSADDRHYLWVGRLATVFGIAACRSAAAYLATPLQQHHGPAAAGVRLRQRAAVRDLPAGHVLEADDRPWRLRRAGRSARWPPPCTTA